MSAAFLTLMAAGAGMNTVGSFYGALSRKSSLGFSADMDEISARLQERSAESMLERGNQQVGQLTQRAGQLKSSQRANMAASGVDVGHGSAAEVQASTDLMKEIDVNTITANAVRDAWGARIQAVGLRGSAQVKRASAAGISPLMTMASTALTSGALVADRWYTHDREQRERGVKPAETKDDTGLFGSWWGKL